MVTRLTVIAQRAITFPYRLDTVEVSLYVEVTIRHFSDPEINLNSAIWCKSFMFTLDRNVFT